MKKRIAIVGTLLGMMCIVVFVAMSQTNDTKVEVVDKPSDELKVVSYASLFTVRAPLDFYYNVSSRFFATISKEDLSRATTVSDVLPAEAGWESYPIQKVIVKRLDNDLEIAKEGGDLTLNDAQLALLRSFEYADNFRLIGDYGSRQELTYFITVVPEQEATYPGGKEALMEYLKRNSAADIINVVQEKLEEGVITFTVNTEGGLSNVKLSSSSGYIDVDLTMIELIKKTAGQWTPAKNAEGEKVDQELVFSFGKMGC